MTLMQTFLGPLIIAIVFNVLLFLVAYSRKTDKLTDFAYGATFFMIAGYCFVRSERTFASYILLAMITMWAVRLSGFLVVRIRKIGRDKRFDEFRGSFFKFGGFWVLQAISAWIIMLPTIYFLTHPRAIVDWQMIVGLALWLVGISFETVADFQKYEFNNDPKNKGKWIATGLWKHSRHPNYFGEITVWFGTYFFAISTLSGVHSLIALVSPLWIGSLIIFVSGIPKLEESADERWGKDKAYQEYKKNTPVLIPKL